MTIPNRVTFDALRNMNDGDVFLLSPEIFVLLQEDLDERKKALQADAALLANALNIRFRGLANSAFKTKGEDTGTVDILDRDGFLVQCERKKVVDWNQETLAAIYEKIKRAGDDPSVYISVETKTIYKVAETAFKNWSDAIKTAFSPARTVTAGVPQYKIKPKKKE